MNEDMTPIFDKICGLDTPELKSLLDALKGLDLELQYRVWITKVDEVMGTLIKHSTADLPDFPFASCFELDILPGKTVHMAAQAIIKKEQESGFPIQNFKEVEF